MECPRSAGEVLGVDDGQAAIAISDQNLIGGAVHADIVGVLAKIDLPGRGIIRSRENAHRSIARVCDVKRIRRRQVSDALWLLQSPHRSNDLFVLEVDDPDGVVAEFGNEEPLPRQINRHVIDSAAHFAEGNLGFELQRLGDWSTNPDQQRRRCDSYRKRKTSKRDHQVSPSLPCAPTGVGSGVYVRAAIRSLDTQLSSASHRLPGHEVIEGGLGCIALRGHDFENRLAVADLFLHGKNSALGRGLLE